ncbi:MAG: threonine/serine exporter family protein [Eubacteriales bacterium]|nr:threonine/serine exporter family protein [Eubacteriales bacterium]
MREQVIQLLTAFFGSLGFAISFQLRRSLWLVASLGGLLSWGCYLAAFAVTGQVFFSSLLASIFAALYSELLAAWKKAPTTLFVIPSVIPLIPGSSLYYTMRAVVTGNTKEASSYGALTLQWSLSIAAGICVVWTLGFLVRRSWRQKGTSPAN